jgi:hypothetical protein
MESERRQYISNDYLKELIKIVNSTLFCEFLLYFKIYKLWNGTLKKMTDPMVYESLRAYERIEWVHESCSGKIKCLLNLGSCFALLIIWIDYKGELIPKCKAIICDSRRELLTSLLNIRTYSKYLRETEEYIKVIISE